jgi:hypothetical protein
MKNGRMLQETGNVFYRNKYQFYCHIQIKQFFYIVIDDYQVICFITFEICVSMETEY